MPGVPGSVWGGVAGQGEWDIGKRYTVELFFNDLIIINSIFF